MNGQPAYMEDLSLAMRNNARVVDVISLDYIRGRVIARGTDWPRIKKCGIYVCARVTRQDSRLSHYITLRRYQRAGVKALR
jgi:hypothetical protein